jgi:hypothetical protein
MLVAVGVTLADIALVVVIIIGVLVIARLI